MSTTAMYPTLLSSPWVVETDRPSLLCVSIASTEVFAADSVLFAERATVRPDAERGGAFPGPASGQPPLVVPLHWMPVSASAHPTRWVLTTGAGRTVRGVGSLMSILG